MQDTKTIKNVKPVSKGTGKLNIFSIFLQAKQKIKEKFEEKYKDDRVKNLGKSKKCECGRYYGLDGGTMRKSKTRKSGYICQVCFEIEKKEAKND